MHHIQATSSTRCTTVAIRWSLTPEGHLHLPPYRRQRHPSHSSPTTHIRHMHNMRIRPTTNSHNLLMSTAQHHRCHTPCTTSLRLPQLHRPPLLLHSTQAVLVPYQACSSSSRLAHSHEINGMHPPRTKHLQKRSNSSPLSRSLIIAIYSMHISTTTSFDKGTKGQLELSCKMLLMYLRNKRRIEKASRKQVLLLRAVCKPVLAAVVTVATSGNEVRMRRMIH